MLTTFTVYLHRAGEDPQFQPLLCSGVAEAMAKVREMLDGDGAICTIDIHLADESIVTIGRPEA